MSPAREKFPISGKKILKKTIASTVGWWIVLGFLLLTLIIVANGIRTLFPPAALIALGKAEKALPIIIACILALPPLLMYFYHRQYFRRYFYDLQENAVVIRKGVFTEKEITIPYTRIQDVFVDQDAFDRLFSLHDVHLPSGTNTPGMEAHIDGLEKAPADGLREAILAAMNSRR